MPIKTFITAAVTTLAHRHAMHDALATRVREHNLQRIGIRSRPAFDLQQFHTPLRAVDHRAPALVGARRNALRTIGLHKRFTML